MPDVLGSQDELDEEIIEMLFTVNKRLKAAGMAEISDHEIKRKYEELELNKQALKIPSVLQQAQSLLPTPGSPSPVPSASPGGFGIQGGLGLGQ